MKLNIKFTLENKVIKDTLRCIAENFSYPVNKFIIVGGFGVQIYSKKNNKNIPLRPSSDIDILPSPLLTKVKFKEKIVPTFQKYLNEIDNGLKTRNSYQIKTGEGVDDFFIHITRFSSEYINRHWSWKKREIDNSQKVNIEDVGEINVFRLEDILANKIRRLGRLYTTNNVKNEKDREYIKNIIKTDFDSFIEDYAIDISNQFNQTLEKRTMLLQKINQKNFIDNIEEITDFKILKDIFDCYSLLANYKNTGFDKSYFKSAISNIPSVSQIV